MAPYSFWNYRRDAYAAIARTLGGVNKEVHAKIMATEPEEYTDKLPEMVQVRCIVGAPLPVLSPSMSLVPLALSELISILLSLPLSLSLTPSLLPSFSPLGERSEGGERIPSPPTDLNMTYRLGCLCLCLCLCCCGMCTFLDCLDLHCKGTEAWRL